MGSGEQGGEKGQEDPRTSSARLYGDCFGLPQDEKEGDGAYIERMAGELRRQGRIIEAHELASGRRWSDPEQGHGGPMQGIIGAIAQIKAGVEYSPHDPSSQIGDDLAAGFITMNPEDSGEALVALFDLIGPESAMDVIDEMRRQVPPQG